MRRIQVVGAGVRRLYERVATRFESTVAAAERRYTPLGRFRPGPFAGWQFLWQPAALGLVAMSLILAGGSFTNSPFKLDMAGTWFFGEPSASPTGTPSVTKFLVAIVLTYGGLVLLMRVWLRLAEVMKIHPGAPMRPLWIMLILWSLPMLIAPPMFSRDVFSYAAQGEMTSYHISPYLYGPFTLGSSPYVNPVDPLWGNAPAPYGPLFLFLDGAITRLSGHHEVVTVLGLRLLEVAAVAVIGVGLTMLARGLGRDPGEAFVLGALNPLVLLTLIGGAHNDAAMTALLVVGVAMAVRRRPWWALAFCAAATAVKAPAAVGLAFVAWMWPGIGPRIRDRVVPALKSAAVLAVTLVVSSWMAGFGFGWVRNLLSNGTVRSWAAPATAVGMALGNTLHAVGLHAISVRSVLSLTRLSGLLIAGAFCVWLLWRGPQRGWVRSLAVALLLVVELGPVVQPWYLAWGLVLLAASYRGREHFWLLMLSITGPFIGLPGGRQLLAGLVHGNPLLLAVAVAVLGGVLVVPMGRWTQWSWASSPEEAALPEPAPVASTSP